MTWLDVLIVVLVLAAAFGGLRTAGGAARGGRLLGLLVGVGIGLALGGQLASFGTDTESAYVYGLVGIVAGLLVGSIVGGFLGGLVSRVLIKAKLTFLDRLFGAVAGAVSALLVVWLVSWLIPALVGPGPLAPATAVVDALGGHSAVVGWVEQVMPDTTDTVRTLVGQARPPG